MQLPELSQAHANHLIYGLACFIAVDYWVVSQHWGNGPTTGLLAAIILGAAKEGVDYWENKKAVTAGQPPVHAVQLGSVVATAMGGVLGFIVSVIR